MSGRTPRGSAAPRAPTPMQEQYLRLKSEVGDALLFFRLGDFYELFGADAEVAAPILEVVLTSREVAPGVRQPMCGVPHHAVTGYAARLLARGLSVAFADQMEDPSQARGLVRREVTRLLTPGTVAEPEMLEALGERLLAVAFGTELAVCDVSTGGVRLALCGDAGGEGAAAAGGMLQELACLRPAEVVVPATGAPAGVVQWAEAEHVALHPLAAEQFRAGAAGAVWSDAPDSPALGALVHYLRHTLRGDLAGLRPVEVYRPSSHLALDPTALRTLEVVEPMAEGATGATLFGALDRCATAMGRRQLRFWLLHPLQDVVAIAARQDAVGELARKPLFREGLRSALRGVHDLERLAARVLNGRIGPRELSALGVSLRALPTALSALRGCDAEWLRRQCASADPLGPLAEQLRRALAEDPPSLARDGGIFAAGYDEELDTLRAAGRDGRAWLAEFEARERERTGIRSLKVGFHKVFGYYLEVSATNRVAVPGDYIRKQTLAAGERFATEELKRLEETILGAQERALRREQVLFAELRERAAADGAALQRTATAVAALDALASLAETAARWGWVRPVVDHSGELQISSGRHPVLDQQLGSGRFVPNDTALGGRAARVVLLTGPNMAGKSTYMRQVALITLLAHVGSFVPAAEARIGLVDRVFTRVGASDDLAGGRSTFMVEMTEVAAALHQASERSLLLLDEVGRGTGTRDGLAIAWAVLEDIATRLRARALFATHYHELAAAAAALPGAASAHAEVREGPDGVVFLHRIAPGPSDRSYGVAVAALAGVPAGVLARAREVLLRLENGLDPADESAAAAPDAPDRPDPRLKDLVLRLAALEPLELTPLQALAVLSELQALARETLGDRTA